MISPTSTSNISQETFDPLAFAPIDIPKKVLLNVPFTPQAPFAEWTELLNEACEEASLVMVEYALRNEELSKQKALDEIHAMVAWQEEQGYTVDVTANEVAEIAKKYLGRNAIVYTGIDVNIINIKRLLAAGYPVIIPAAGQLLENPYFTGDGPPYHMLVIRGYTSNIVTGDKFITNDPGTRRGEEYKYPTDTIESVIHDWTGSKSTITSGQKAMVVLGH